MLEKVKYDSYVNILKEELVPAMGCTEPISIAYAACKCMDVLGCYPEEAKIGVSGNIVKNVKSVTVPHTGGMKGIKSAFIAGLVGGNPNSELEVLANVTDEQIAKMPKAKEELPVEIYVPDDAHIFDLRITLKAKGHEAYLRIVDTHTNIVQIKYDGEILFEHEAVLKKEKTSRSLLTVEDIFTFANEVKINDIKETLDRQINYNMAIANEGLTNPYGANVGKTLLKAFPNDVRIQAKAYAAAGSDARMNGCELPVIINSGSGNQGMTTSIPVIIYARHYCKSQEELYRALCISNLITIHLKSGIGTLSAYCGVVSAGAGAGCGIAYLLGGDLKEISHTLVNTLAIDSGIICDGAKASCAAKISTAVEAGILGYEMYKNGNQFMGGDGIIKKGVENTIDNVSRLARDGMSGTDKEIIKIMIE